jgi:hypothetical protein
VRQDHSRGRLRLALTHAAAAPTAGGSAEKSAQLGLAAHSFSRLYLQLVDSACAGQWRAFLVRLRLCNRGRVLARAQGAHLRRIDRRAPSIYPLYPRPCTLIRAHACARTCARLPICSSDAQLRANEAQRPLTGGTGGGRHVLHARRRAAQGGRRGVLGGPFDRSDAPYRGRRAEGRPHLPRRAATVWPRRPM